MLAAAVMALLIAITGRAPVETSAAVFRAEPSAVPALPSPSGSSNAYYVGPSGSDSGSGTSTAPFRTIQEAANVAGPGSTIIVNNGTYTGSNTGAGKPGCTPVHSCNVLVLSRSGTAGYPITLEAANPFGAVISGFSGATASTGYCILFLPGVSYINIIGFDIQGCYAAGIETSNGAQNHDLLISQNHIHAIAELVLDSCSDYGYDGIYIGTSNYNVVIDRNTINNIGRSPDSCGNSFDYLHDHGIYPNGHDITITNNLFYAEHSGYPIKVTTYGYPGDGTNFLIANNTFGSSGNPYLRKFGDISLDSSGCKGTCELSGTIENNISYAPDNGYFFSMYFGPGASVWAIENNLIGNSAALYSSGGGSVLGSGNVLNTNPLLVAPTASPDPNFALQAASPAIGAGVANGAIPPLDWSGRPHAGKPVIGALEPAFP
jgi:hypothetical protein